MSRHWREGDNPDLNRNATWGLYIRFKYSKSLPFDRILQVDDALSDPGLEHFGGFVSARISENGTKHTLIAMHREGVLRAVLEQAEVECAEAFEAAGLSDLYPTIPRLVHYSDEAAVRADQEANPGKYGPPF